MLQDYDGQRSQLFLKIHVDVHVFTEYSVLFLSENLSKASLLYFQQRDTTWKLVLDFDCNTASDHKMAQDTFHGRLFEREAEQARLLETFERQIEYDAKRELILITGRSGTGKVTFL